MEVAEQYPDCEVCEKRPWSNVRPSPEDRERRFHGVASQESPF